MREVTKHRYHINAVPFVKVYPGDEQVLSFRPAIRVTYISTGFSAFLQDFVPNDDLMKFVDTFERKWA